MGALAERASGRTGARPYGLRRRNRRWRWRLVGCLLKNKAPLRGSLTVRGVDPARGGRPMWKVGREGGDVGCATDPDGYCPSPGTRGRCWRVHRGAMGLRPDPVPGFIDIAANTHSESIGAVAGLGIAGNCADGMFRYCPDASVTRGEMAVALARALNLVLPLPARPSGRLAFNIHHANDEIIAMEFGWSNVGDSRQRCPDSDRFGRGRYPDCVPSAIATGPSTCK